MIQKTEVPDAAGRDPAFVELREAYASGELIVCVGAGVSAAAGLPSWERLVELLAERARARKADARARKEIAALSAKQQYVDALSAAEQALLLLFRNRPTLAAELLSDALKVPLPDFTEARIEPGDLTEVVPRELRADQMVVLYDSAVRVMSIVVEAQLRPPDDNKIRAWVGYVAGSFMRNRCQACLLVVTTDRAVAARCAKPIVVGPGSTIGPLVLGPGAVPVITEPEAARSMPELAVLSVMAHGQSEVGPAVAQAALAAAAGLDEERATLYGDVVLSCMSEAAKRALEEMMASGGYEIQNEFIRKNVEKGRTEGRAEGWAEGIAKGVLTVLEARGLVIPDEVRQRVAASSDLAELERWLRRAAVVGSACEIFDP